MRNYSSFFMMLVLAAGLWACSSTETKNDLKIDRANAISVTAKVEAVDQESRVVTLRGPDGKGFTVLAGKEVVNLPQVEIGDEVVVVYVKALSVRMAQSGEFWDESVKEIAQAMPGTKPGAVEVNEKTVTATIEDIDKSLETASLRMPDGNLNVVKVKDPANLDKVKIGDRIVISYAEAVGISVQKPAN